MLDILLGNKTFKEGEYVVLLMRESAENVGEITVL